MIYPYKKKLLKLKPKELLVIQKAKAYDVGFLANENLAKEFFEIEFQEEDFIRKVEFISSMAKDAIKLAQMSKD